jgi:protein-tyrosine phosphatase
MIDLHCHILPGIDDGPGHLDESVEMCRIAASDGIRTVVATPHFNPGVYESDEANVSERLSALREKVREEGLPIEILRAADNALTPELLGHLGTRKHLTINQNGRYVLIEFPHLAVVHNYERVFLTMMERGIIPIITHPERNPYFRKNPSELYSIVSMGAVIQITAMSITGGFGSEVQEFSLFLLRKNIAHIIATDAHSRDFRPPLLSVAVDRAGEVVGKERAKEMVGLRPSAIIEGKTLLLPKPLPLNEGKRCQQRLWV